MPTGNRRLDERVGHLGGTQFLNLSNRVYIAVVLFLSCSRWRTYSVSGEGVYGVGFDGQRELASSLLRKVLRRPTHVERGQPRTEPIAEGDDHELDRKDQDDSDRRRGGHDL